MNKSHPTADSNVNGKPFAPRIADSGAIRLVTAGADSTGEEELGGWYCAIENVPLKPRS